MNENETLPKHMLRQYGSTRAFKAEKRRLIRGIRKLANELVNGAAYMPREAREPHRQMLDGLRGLEDVLSTENWGR